MERLKEIKEKEERREIPPPILYVSKEPTKNIEKVFRKFKVNLTNVLVWAIIIAIAGFFIFYYFYGSSEIRYEGTTYVGKGNGQTPLLKIKTPQEALAEKVSEFRDSVFSLEKKIHELVNKERAKYNLSSLNWDEKLAEIARYHSKDMAEKNYFDHVNPLTNEDFKDRYKKFNYVCEIVVGNTIYGGAENIFLTYVYNSYSYDPNTNEIEKYNFNSLDDVAISAVEGWMNSEGHRKNILTKFFTKEGIGVYVDSDGEIFITQNFC
jgi:uncharacterized protein YkwD